MTTHAARVEEEDAEEDRSVLSEFIVPGTPAEVVSRYAALPALARSSDFGELDDNVVVLDTETTGLSFSHDELTQIAAARIEDGEVVERFVTFVNPGKPIPENVVHLTGIHDEDVADALSPDDALGRLVVFTGDAKIVAHNVEFDRHFTTRHPSGYPLLENTWIDSLDLARISLPRLKSHRLLDLVRAFGAPESTHRADEDVTATCALFRILLAAVKSMPVSLVEEIAAMATPRQWSTVVVFAYFAHRLAPEERGTPDGGCVGDAAGEKDSQADEGASGSAATERRRAFSLRDMRKSRVGSEEDGRQGEPRPREFVSFEDEDADGPVDIAFPSEADIDEAFSPSGIVGSLYDDYELRDEQLDMAQAVLRAFASSDNLAVEAGTGVGKSMAYLAPAALTAQAGHVQIGIATKTNALLDQLVYDELPALAQALEDAGRPLTFAALKGFTHYPCLRKLERLLKDGVAMKTVDNVERSQAPALAALLSYVEQTKYDDIDDLKIDYRVLPRQSVTTTSRDCLRRKCPFYGRLCFVHGARRAAEAADIVVTNHSLLFCSLAGAVNLLPPIRFWIVDEAHGAEDEARRAFSLELSADALNGLAARVSPGKATRSAFDRAESAITADGTGEQKEQIDDLRKRADDAGRGFSDASAAFLAHIRDLLAYDSSRAGRGYEYADLWIGDEVRRSAEFDALAGYAKTMSRYGADLVTTSQEIVGCLEKVDGTQAVQREVATIALDAQDVLRAIDVILAEGSQSYAYAAHVCRRSDKAKGTRGPDKLEALLYDVGAEMDETLFEQTRSVVFSSATLTIGDSFEAFERSLGLNSAESSHCTALALGSSYDFDSHMKIYVAKDVPEPGSPHHLEELQRFLARVHLAQEGSMLTLFTNRREMEKCFDAVYPVLQKRNLRLVCQKWGVSTKGLRDDFLADEHLSLFALKSFWEGFDAPGATLKGVIIPKLPFSKPTDPLSCERAFRDDQAWKRYVLPAAVLETKQAAGRLIRKSDDKGVLILADRRLVTKWYGHAFLGSLQSKNICECTMDQIVRDIEHGSGLF